MKLRQLTGAEKERIWADVRREFPDDPLMQEIHFVQYLHYEQTLDLSPDERRRFYNNEDFGEGTKVESP